MDPINENNIIKSELESIKKQVLKLTTLVNIKENKNIILKHDQNPTGNWEFDGNIETKYIINNKQFCLYMCLSNTDINSPYVDSNNELGEYGPTINLRNIPALFIIIRKTDITGRLFPSYKNIDTFDVTDTLIDNGIYVYQKENTYWKSVTFFSDI